MAGVFYILLIVGSVVCALASDQSEQDATMDPEDSFYRLARSVEQSIQAVQTRTDTTPAVCESLSRCGFNVLDVYARCPIGMFVRYCLCPDGEECMFVSREWGSRYDLYKCLPMPTTQPITTTEAATTEATTVSVGATADLTTATYVKRVGGLDIPDEL